MSEYRYEVDYNDSEGDEYSDSTTTLPEFRKLCKQLRKDGYDIVRTYRYVGDEYKGPVPQLYSRW